jgi:hypothetical protein
MTIKTYEFYELTNIISEMFPKKPCDEWYCKYNVGSLSEYYRLSSGLMSGNNFAFKKLSNFIKGKNGENGENDGSSKYDLSSPSNFLYYNNNKEL